MLDVLQEKVLGCICPQTMQNSHVFAVGAGGANGIYEDLFRVGLGALTVIDFDVVDASNLVTQGWRHAQIGQSKVHALEESIGAIVPSIKDRRGVVPITDDFLSMTDEQLVELAGDASVLMFMCDDFYAQARGNRLALKLQKPAIFAIMYENAHCCEVTFTIPEVTPGCHRCATSNRYQAYLEGGFVNEVGSQGSMIFQTHMLNDLIGMITLAILHRDVRRQGFWDQWRPELRESLAHLVGLIMRRVCGDASVAFRASFV